VKAQRVKVYLIRHAQSEENVLSLRQKTTIKDFNDMLNDSPKTPLTRWGRFQAQIMAGQFDGAHLQKIYTSPFDRAVQTAKTIGREFGLTPEIVHDLREVLPRQLHDLQHGNTQQSLGRLLFRSYIEMALPVGPGETLPACLWRARRVWNQLTRGSDQEIVIVSHYGLISLILLNLRYNHTWRIVSRDVSNGGVSIITKKGSKR
jgi:broad specificity phosphatase PhoE